MQVAAHGEGAFLVTGVDQPVEAFGGVSPTASMPMSSTMITSTRVMRWIALLIESSARCQRKRTPRSSMPNQATVRPVSMAY